MVLICGHTKRDIRCGVMAPLIEREFLAVLKRENLAEKVDVGLISHIGGHAYAGNVIYFPADASRMPVTWYGRVFPENVQGIVQTTIKEGKINKKTYTEVRWMLFNVVCRFTYCVQCNILRTTASLLL